MVDPVELHDLQRMTDEITTRDGRQIKGTWEFHIPEGVYRLRLSIAAESYSIVDALMFQHAFAPVSLAKDVVVRGLHGFDALLKQESGL